jgi:hypothetical protein
MKWTFIISFVILKSVVSNCQPTSVTWSFHIANLQIIPSNPLPGQEVKVAFSIGTFQGASYESENLITSGNDLQASICMGIYMTTDSYNFQDTISLGVLTEGVYNLRLIGRGDYGPTICDDFPTVYDSAYIDTTFTVSYTNSLMDLDENVQLIVYPNPVDDEMHFAEVSFTNCEIVFYSIDGKEVMRQKIQDQNKIDVSLLQSGSYVIQILVDDAVYTAKFIKE